MKRFKKTKSVKNEMSKALDELRNGSVLQLSHKSAFRFIMYLEDELGFSNITNMINIETGKNIGDVEINKKTEEMYRIVWDDKNQMTYWFKKDFHDYSVEQIV